LEEPSSDDSIVSFVSYATAATNSSFVRLPFWAIELIRLRTQV
jgi:hypothetical protein